VAVLFPGDLRPVPDEETRETGELVLGLGHDLNHKLFGDELAAGSLLVQTVGLVKFKNNAARVAGVGRFQGLE
jgi:hypothetical protein